VAGFAGLAPVQVRLQIGFRKFKSRRAAVNNAQIPRPVALAAGGDGKQLAEGIT
jgi:hypothetical protein